MKDDKSTETALTRKVKYAPFNLRMIAALIDVLPLLILTMPIWSSVENMLFPPMDSNGIMYLMSNPLPQEDFQQRILEQLSQQHLLGRLVVVNFLQVALLALYIIPCWMKFHNTFGKMVVGIEIRDAVTHELMTRRQMVKRFLGYIVAGIPVTLGFVWMLFNRKRQGWHDKIAGTVVVVKEKRPFSLTLKSKSQ